MSIRKFCGNCNNFRPDENSEINHGKCLKGYDEGEYPYIITNKTSPICCTNYSEKRSCSTCIFLGEREETGFFMCFLEANKKNGEYLPIGHHAKNKHFCDHYAPAPKRILQNKTTSEKVESRFELMDLDS